VTKALLIAGDKRGMGQPAELLSKPSSEVNYLKDEASFVTKNHLCEVKEFYCRLSRWTAMI